jgi:glycine cleavage system regulatory protein
MSEFIDPKALQALITRINGTASALTAIEAGLIQATPENILTVIWTLRGTADKLEKMTREGAENANP